MAAQQQTLQELSTPLKDTLRKIVVDLELSYAVLWKLTIDESELRWQEGVFNLEKSGVLSELFYSVYSTCCFTAGVGFAGYALERMTNSILWMTRDEFQRLEIPLDNQTLFLGAAGIQTVVCLPLGSLVLEIGTIHRVQGGGESANRIRRVLLDLLRSELPTPMRYINPAPPQVHISTPAVTNGVNRVGLTNGVNRTGLNPFLFPAVNHVDPPMVASTVSPVATVRELSFPSGLGGFNSKSLAEPVYSQAMQQQQLEGSYSREIAHGLLNIVSPQLSIEVPELPTVSSESWAPDVISSPLSHMELNVFQSWTTAMAEEDIPLAATSTSHGRHHDFIAEELDREMAAGMQLLPFAIDNSLDNFMAGTLDAAGGASRHGSSSRSSAFSPEENEISSAILENYADHQLSGLDSGRCLPSGAAMLPGESENGLTMDHRRSAASSKEASPESNPPPPPSAPSAPSAHSALDRSPGIHPRLVASTSFPNNKFPTVGISQHASSQYGTINLEQTQRNLRLDQQLSGVTLDLKPEPESGPALVQCGNVLQLGNASGQVIEALPQEHDEAAFSHMLAERRRRNKQNENFSQLKTIIPSAAKMDKASLLAHTIRYIQDLKERISELEESNHSLMQTQMGAERLNSGSESPGSATTLRVNNKGSPNRHRVRSPNSVSPPTEDIDMLQVRPDGDGNLKIEISTPCSSPDTGTQLFSCLNELHFKLINASVNIADNRMHASIVVKTKRKNSAGQSAVCAEVEHALAVCLKSSSN